MKQSAFVKQPVILHSVRLKCSITASDTMDVSLTTSMKLEKGGSPRDRVMWTCDDALPIDFNDAMPYADPSSLFNTPPHETDNAIRP